MTFCKMEVLVDVCLLGKLVIASKPEMIRLGKPEESNEAALERF